MRVLVAPQEFKGTLTAVQATEAIASALRAAFAGWDLDLLPMADGGPGTVPALLAARGGELKTAVVPDPLLRQVEARWGLLPSGTAVIEGAEASGLWRLRPEELDPRRATTRGTGELIAAALDYGCREVILGLGGSGTNDGGAGMAKALGFRLLDARGVSLPPGGAALASLDHIDTGNAHAAIAPTHFVGATDVLNPLCGPEGASAVYGPQKGADPVMVQELDAALGHFAAVVKRDLGVDIRNVPGAGAFGGGGGGAIAFLGAELRSGAEVVAQAAGLEERVRDADLVITGEGRLDAQTSFGKGPLHIARLSRAQGSPVICIVGSLGDGHERLMPWFDVLESTTSTTPTTLPSPDKAADQIGQAAVTAVLRFLAGRKVSRF